MDELSLIERWVVTATILVISIAGVATVGWQLFFAMVVTVAVLALAVGGLTKERDR